MGHVNDAVYATDLEQARAGSFGDVIGESRPIPPAWRERIVAYRSE